MVPNRTEACHFFSRSSKNLSEHCLTLMTSPKSLLWSHLDMTEQLVGEFNSLLLFVELFEVLPDNLGDWAKCFIKMLRLFKYEASEVMTSNMASCNFLASKLMLFKMPLFITSGSSDHIDLRPPVQAEVRSIAEGRVRDLFKVLVSISRPSSDSWIPKINK